MKDAQSSERPVAMNAFPECRPAMIGFIVDPARIDHKALFKIDLVHFMCGTKMRLGER